jgi:hypothetical protein
LFANYASEGWGADNCESPGVGQPCTRSNLVGSTTFNRGNALTNVSRIERIWDVNPSIGGPIKRDKLWFHYTFRHWGVEKTVVDSYFDADPSPLRYVADVSRPGIDDGYIVSNAVRVSWGISAKDKLSVYHDNQRKYRNHWGIQATIPPEAAAVQVTPTSFVNVTKWTRTHTNRLLFEGGVGMYNQEYTELYHREGLGLRGDPQVDRLQRSRPVEQPSLASLAQPGRSLLGAAYVHGRRVVRHGQPQLAVRRHVVQWRLAAD